jgi:hypothetical protein
MSHETYAAAIGMQRSGVFRLLCAGKHGMFTDNFRRRAEVLKTSRNELRSRIGSDAIDRSEMTVAERGGEFSSGVSGQAQPMREVTEFYGITARPRAERTDLQRGGEGFSNQSVGAIQNLQVTPRYPINDPSTDTLPQGHGDRS